MNRSKERDALVIAFVIAAIAVWALDSVAAGQEAAQATGSMLIDVEGARPLDKAISELTARHGWAITYEELPLQFAGDATDAARTLRKDSVSTKPLLVAKGGRLRFAYEALPNRENEEAVLLALLREYRASDPPYGFRLVRAGDVFHVIPETSRDARGVHEERTALLDTKISISAKDRNVEEMIREIVAAVSAKADSRLSPPGRPSNLFMQTRVTGGADNEAARSVLLRTLKETGQQVVWAVLCSPTASDMPGCTLNTRLVTSPTR